MKVAGQQPSPLSWPLFWNLFCHNFTQPRRSSQKSSRNLWQFLTAQGGVLLTLLKNNLLWRVCSLWPRTMIWWKVITLPATLQGEEERPPSHKQVGLTEKHKEPKGKNKFSQKGQFPVGRSQWNLERHKSRRNFIRGLDCCPTVRPSTPPRCRQSSSLHVKGQPPTWHQTRPKFEQHTCKAMMSQSHSSWQVLGGIRWCVCGAPSLHCKRPIKMPLVDQALSSNLGHIFWANSFNRTSWPFHLLLPAPKEDPTTTTTADFISGPAPSVSQAHTETCVCMWSCRTAWVCMNLESGFSWSGLLKETWFLSLELWIPFRHEVHWKEQGGSRREISWSWRVIQPKLWWSWEWREREEGREKLQWAVCWVWCVGKKSGNMQAKKSEREVKRERGTDRCEEKKPKWRLLLLTSQVVCVPIVGGKKRFQFLIDWMWMLFCVWFSFLNSSKKIWQIPFWCHRLIE